MAKVKSTWEGLHEGPSGTYIRPHGNGYSFGRWSRSLIPTLGYRFEALGERSTVEACREALKADDIARERRSKALNQRRNGRR